MIDLPGQQSFLMTELMQWQLEYDKANPDIYEQFEKRTLALARKGRKRLGAQMIIEVIRYFTLLESDEGDYKINNNITSYYSRKFMRENPAYEDIFQLREKKI